MGIQNLEVSTQSNKFDRQIIRFKNKLKRSLRRMFLQKGNCTYKPSIK